MNKPSLQVVREVITDCTLRILLVKGMLVVASNFVSSAFITIEKKKTDYFLWFIAEDLQNRTITIANAQHFIHHTPPS